ALVPERVSGHNYSLGMQSDPRDTRRCAGRLAEEIHEHSLFRHGVLVGQDTYGSGFFQNLQQSARGLVFEDRLVAGQSAIAIDQRIDAWVVERSRHIVQRKTVES